MAIKKKARGEPKVTVEWLDEHATLNTSRNIKPRKDALPAFNPFKGTIKEETIDDGHQILLRAYEAGRVDLEDAIQALDASYRANHSVGNGILYDQRLKPINRIDRYVKYAVSVLGQDEDEAREYAFKEIASQTNLAGDWGKVTKEVGIDIEELREEFGEEPEE